MKTIKYLVLLLICGHLTCLAQQPVPVGRGSYAEYPPLSKSNTADHPGDQSQKMLNKKLYITERMKDKPVPTNDWWTDLIVSQYSGNLWAYPIVANAEEYGIYVEFPKHWTDDGCELKSASQLQVGGRQFRPESADVDFWHDWGFEFIMQDAEKQMRVTMAHGMPFVWLETKELTLQIPYAGEKLYTETGEVTLPVTTSRLAIEMEGDVYGLYAPAGTTFSIKNDQLEITFSAAKQYLSIGVLPDVTLLEEFALYAYSVPRDTEVTWRYDESQGKLHTFWKVATENLNGNAANRVLQGFIPHHYKNSYTDFSFTGHTYQTPRGIMRMAEGNNFTISYDFSGIVPYWAAPEEDFSYNNPYDRERMMAMIDDYGNKGTFGGDTYWGGKGLTQMALYMTFAHEMGEEELFEKCKARLKEVLINWLTYTPGEDDFFFARYDNWKALVGYNTSYDSDTFNDHHFHYGYFTYSAALLCLFDDQFKADYGEMVTLLAKEYANWDRNDQDFPFFRTLDPWAGHSYAGGLGGWNGNGQESSSEAMQGWGGVYTLGLALNNKEIRDAGIFGWLLESRGTAEYWFDRDRENIDYTRYTKPYNSNLTSQGIGWWTWFSGDPVWMHSIQWLPISPMLSYLYQDLEYAQWEYTQMWESKEIGGWLTTPSNSALSNESGLGNVVLSYLQIFDADSAAAVFDNLWQHNMPMVKNADTGGITYYATHSHRTYGEIQWNVYSDIPSSSCYYHAGKDQYTFVVYNHETSERTCNFYKDGEVISSFKVPARKQITYQSAPFLAELKIVTPAEVVEPGTSVQLEAQPLSQYETIVENVTVEWQLEGEGEITQNGVFTASSNKGTVTITASAGTVQQQITLRIDDKPELAIAQIVPDVKYLEPETEVNFSLEMKDQYELNYITTIDWTILKDGTVVKEDSVFNLTAIGAYTVKAKAEGKEFTQNFTLLPTFPNIAVNKTAVASSEENPGTIASHATDGDKTTRWGSEHRDGEWIYVDLNETCYIGRVGILWEDSYATLYEIQISDDAQEWTTVKRVNGTGGYETISVDKYARYVRMYGLERINIYGFSIYEFEVYGIPESLELNDLFGLQILPESVFLKEEESVQLDAKAYNGYGQPVGAEIQWSIDGQGEITPEGLFTPLQYGKMTVTASSGQIKTEKTYLVEESFKLQSIQLLPRTAALIVGKSQEFEIDTKDQFDTEFPADGLTFEIIGEGATFENNIFTSNTVGEFMLIAGKGAVKDTVHISVAEIQDVNLALNKPSYASGSENESMLPQYANDGDLSTRWSSTFYDNQYLQIDLSADYVLNRVKLFWQESYATSYRIEVSLDEDEWTTVYTNDECRGGEEVIEFAPVAARYVKLVCLTRSTIFGASLWEIEIYGTHEWIDARPADFVVSPQPLAFYMEETTPVEVTVLDQYGLVYKTEYDVLHNVNGGGSFDTNYNFTPAETGDYKMTFTYGSLSKEYPFTVYPARELYNLFIIPTYYKAKVNEEIQFTAKGVDQYGNDYPVEVRWNSSGGSIDQNGLFSAPYVGSYTIIATAGNKTTNVVIEVIEVSDENLAYNKPVWASSEITPAEGAVDENQGTRWESFHQDGPEWLAVNLQNAYYITDVEIDWELASAANYDIQVSVDGENWTTVQEVRGKSGARTDKFRISATGQYIRIYCILRSGEWGYSIIELRVYGQAMQEGEPYTISFVNPAVEAEVGTPVSYEVEVRDCYSRSVIDYPLTWMVEGKGYITSEGVFNPHTIGEHKLIAYCGLISTSHLVVVNNSATNIESYYAEPIYVKEGNELYVYGNKIQRAVIYDFTGKMLRMGSSYEEGNMRINNVDDLGFCILYVETREGSYSYKLRF